MTDTHDKTNIDPDDEERVTEAKKSRFARREFTASEAIISEINEAAEANIDENDPVHELIEDHTITGRYSEYQMRGYRQALSPERSDPFADGGKTPAHDSTGTTYADVMQKKQLKEAQRQLEIDIAKKVKAGDLKESEVTKVMAEVTAESKAPAKKKRRWDATPQDLEVPTLGTEAEDDADKTPAHLAKTPAIHSNKWDATPAHVPVAGENAEPKLGKRNRWDETPAHQSGNASLWGETPRTITMTGDDDETLMAKSSSKRRSRWDATPADMGATPSLGAATPVSSMGMATPVGTPGGATPKFGDAMGATPQYGGMTPSGATPTGNQLYGLQPRGAVADKLQLES